MSRKRRENFCSKQKSYRTNFLIGIALNILFVAIEAGFAFKINSLALLSDAVHNLSDVAGLLLTWAGIVISQKSPSTTHSYGWKKGSVFAAFINSLFLIFVMSTIGWEAINRFRSPVEAEGFTMISVASVGIFVNLSTAILLHKGSDKDINIRSAFLHMLADALVSVGVVFAGILIMKFHYTWIDPVTSLLIAVIVILATWKLFLQSLHLLFDGVPESVNLVDVRKFLASQPGVTNVLDLHIWALATTEIALSVHLQIPEGHPGDEFLTEIAKELQDQFEIDHVTIQVVKKPLSENYCS